MGRAYFEDIEVGVPFGGQSYAVEREEMLVFAQKWDPRAMHIDEQAGVADSGDRETGARYHSFVGEKFARSLGTGDRNNLGIVANPHVGQANARGSRRRGAALRYGTAQWPGFGITEETGETICCCLGGDVFELARLIVGIAGAKPEVFGEEGCPKASNPEHSIGHVVAGGRQLDTVVRLVAQQISAGELADHFIGRGHRHLEMRGEHRHR